MASGNARPSWIGTFKVGSIEIPVQLLPASSDDKSPFVSVHAVDDGRIETKKRCTASGCAKDLAGDDIVQAVEVSKGVYSRVTADELAALATSNRNGGVVEFDWFPLVENVPPDCVEKSYHVVPDPALTDPAAFALFRAALGQTGRAAVGKIAFQGKERIAVVFWRSHHGALRLCTLRMASEMRDLPVVDLSEPDESIVKDMAGLFFVLTHRAGNRGLDFYYDEYSERLDALVARKKSGRAPVQTSVSLQDELKRSAARVRRSLKTKEKTAA